jgi:hypothetical protein
MVMRFLWIAVVIALFFGCSADYDEFGESPYHKLDEIHFVEETGGIQVFVDEHRVVITLDTVPDSLDTWDSVTVESIDVSNMASLHLVESKILEFPADSAALDSLAGQVAYVEKKLKKGSRIRLPASRIIYVVVIAENGDMSIWKIQFEIPGEESHADSPEENGEDKPEEKKEENAKSSDNSISFDFKDAVETRESGDTIYVTYPQGFDIKTVTLSNASVSGSAKVSPDPKSVKDWSTPQKFKVTAEDGSEKNWVVVVTSIKNNATDLQLLFKDQFKVNRSQDSIYIKLKNGSSVGSAAIDSWSISEGATVDPKPDAIKAWKDYQSFKVTAEDGTVKTWVLSLSVAAADEKVSSDKELVSISAVGEESAASIDESKKVVELHLASDADPSSVKVTLKVSETASHNLPETVDLRSPVTFTITAEDASSETWTLSASIPSEPPQVLSLKIAGKQAVIDASEMSIHVDSLPFRTNLTSLELTELKLSKGATAEGFSVGSKYDFGAGQTLVVKNTAGESVTYRVKAGYQLPGSDFNNWSSNDPKPDTIWNNANTIIETTKKYTKGSMIGAEIKTNSLLGKVASGSLYTAVFNPKGVGTMSMASSDTWPDGNELLDFGKPFAARPEYMEIKISYSGSGDSCDAYILLENRTGDKNMNRKASDVNKLVASAWYRSTTGNNTGRSNPDVVSVSEPDANGMRTIRLKLTYGNPLKGSPIENSSTFNTILRSSDKNAVNNGLIQGTGEEAVTHIRVVFASSADGNHYKGNKGATLIVDEMRLIY